MYDIPRFYVYNFLNKGKNIMQRLNQIEKEEKDVGKGRKGSQSGEAKHAKTNGFSSV